MILVFFGMTASGKSTLAALCATRWQVPHHNTDQVRKELAGLAAGTPRPDGIDQGIYTRELGYQDLQVIYCSGVISQSFNHAYITGA